jgi:hypothetical protein
MPDRLWDRATLESRIQNAPARRRYAGGSPDAKEIAAYSAGLPRSCEAGAWGVVLGMTPELRTLALSWFEHVLSIDQNPAAIALYRDWAAPVGGARESILEADWFALPDLLSRPVSAILGDGVFGNLPDLPAHTQLLGRLRSALAPHGRLVTRMALIPEGFNPARHRMDRLLAEFRAGVLDAAEFGFGARLVGHFESCYDPRTCVLDNAQLYAQCAARHAAGTLTWEEWGVIRRYYYGGTNCILPQREWERSLSETGWGFQILRCQGKAWYEYYPVYACEPRPGFRTG